MLQKNWPAIILTISCLSITTALVAQYMFNLLPCKMCYYQRYVYYTIILLTLIFLIFKIKKSLIYLIIIEILLLIGLTLSLWHVGIENNLIEGTSGCSNILLESENPSNNINVLKEYILNNPIATCDQTNWSFLGISFAIYNAILQVVLLIINSILILKLK